MRPVNLMRELLTVPCPICRGEGAPCICDGGRLPANPYERPARADTAIFLAVTAATLVPWLALARWLA